MSTALEGSSARERGAGTCVGCGALEGSAMRASIRPRPRHEAPVAPGSAGREASSRVGAEDARGHLPGSPRSARRRRSRAAAERSARCDRAHRGQRHMRLGPAHLPRAREDRAGLHDRARVRGHRAGGRGSGGLGGGRRPRAGLLSDGVRALLLLPVRLVSQVRSLAHVRPRRHAGLAAGHPGRAGAGAQRRPRAAQAPRGNGRRDRAVRGRRDGHRLPRRGGGRRAPWRRRNTCRWFQTAADPAD